MSYIIHRGLLRRGEGHCGIRGRPTLNGCGPRLLLIKMEAATGVVIVLPHPGTSLRLESAARAAVVVAAFVVGDASVVTVALPTAAERCELAAVVASGMGSAVPAMTTCAAVAIAAVVPATVPAVAAMEAVMVMSAAVSAPSRPRLIGPPW